LRCEEIYLRDDIAQLIASEPGLKTRDRQLDSFGEKWPKGRQELGIARKESGGAIEIKLNSNYFRPSLFGAPYSVLKRLD
jgi:hypothetical protein